MLTFVSAFHALRTFRLEAGLPLRVTNARPVVTS